MNGSAWAARLARNRFMPLPPADLMLCGDGDFKAIGAEFVTYFIDRAGLLPSMRVLDVGCGVGRMALPLTQYLSDLGSYAGVDIIAPAIDWCAQMITPAYSNFIFHHVDLQHPVYHPHGKQLTIGSRLPFADGAFDFIFMASVLTHLDPDEVTHYAAEAARLLAPGGKCLVTAFLMNPPALAALRGGTGRIAFDPALAGPVWHADSEVKLAAVAFDEDFLLERFLRVGLRRNHEADYGHWSGRPMSPFQDICIFDGG